MVLKAIREKSGIRSADLASHFDIFRQQVYQYNDIPVSWLSYVTKKSGLSISEIRPDLYKGIKYTCEHCGKKGKLK